MKKRALATILATAMVASLATGVTAVQADDDIVITVASRYSAENPDENYYRQKVEEFNALDNGITVEMDNIATESDYLDKLRTSFANGDTPNVFVEYGGSRTLDYLEADALLDLKPYLEENDSEWYNTFYEGFWGASVYEGYDGIYSVPFKCYVVPLFYNKTIFNELGLEVPTTIDELLEVCAAVKEAGYLPFQAGEKDNYRFGHFHNNLVVKMLGVDAVDQLGNRELAYDSDEMKATYQVMVDMFANGYFGEDVLDTDSAMENEIFKSGKVAMKWDGSWFVPNELFGTDFYDEVGVAAFPYGDEACASYGQGGASDLWYVSQLGKSEEEIAASVEFIKYITSPEYYVGLDEVAQTIVPVKFEKSENSPENPLLDELIEIQNTMTDLRTDVQNYDIASHMLDTVRSSLQGIAMGDDADTVAQNIVDRIAEYE